MTGLSGEATRAWLYRRTGDTERSTWKTYGWAASSAVAES